MPVFDKCISPDDIIPEMMSVYTTLKDEVGRLLINLENNQSNTHSLLQTLSKIREANHESHTDDEVSDEPDEVLGHLSTHELAARLNKDELITRVGPGEYAIRKTTYSDNRITTVIPKSYSQLKCSCPATNLCPHLIGVQIWLGSFDHETKKPRNTTTTLKNSLRAAEKTSGRKKPRKIDVDVTKKNRNFPSAEPKKFTHQKMLR